MLWCPDLFLKTTSTNSQECLSVTSNAENMTAHTELAEKYLVIYQLPKTNLEMIPILEVLLLGFDTPH